MEYIDEAVRSQIWGRVFLFAPTGGGKSRAAFELGSRLFGGLPMTYINTEVDREKLYADRFKFALIDISDAEEAPPPEVFVEALSLAESRNPGGVIILDSAFHEWRGVLNLADRFGDWKQVRPRHNAFVEKMARLNAHLIVCCRAKMQYKVDEEERDGRKRQTVMALGVGPQTDGDLQYEFNLVGQLEQVTHECTWTGHVDDLVGTVVNFGDPAQADAVAETYTKWLSVGTPIEIPVAAEDEAVAALVASLLEEGIGQDKIDATFAVARKEGRGVLAPEYVAEQTKKSADRLKRKAAAKAKAAAEAAGSDSAAANASGDAAAPAEAPEAATEPEAAAETLPVG